MSWLTLIVATVRLLTSLSIYLRDRDLISRADAVVLADVLQKQADEIDKGRAARLAQRARDADGMSVGVDPFRRD